MKRDIECRVCDEGYLVKRRRYRMSSVVVLIGYILLIPSILGMLMGVLGALATDTASEEVNKDSERELRRALTAEEIPVAMIELAVSGEVIPDSQMQQLSPEQRDALQRELDAHLARDVGAGCATAVTGLGSIGIILASLVGGLLGWLLVMKKTILQCDTCSAVIAAS